MIKKGRSPFTVISALWQVNPRECHMSDAVRNAVGVAIPLFGGIIFHQASIGVAMTVGALVGGFGVLKGTERRRRRMFALAALWLGMATFIGAYTGSHLWINIAVVMVSGFVAGIATSAGLDAMQLGIFATTALVVFSGFPAALLQSLAEGLAVLAGAVLQGLLYLLVETIRRPQSEELLSLRRLITSIQSYCLSPDDHHGLDVARRFLEAEEALNDSRLPSDPWSKYRELVDIMESIRSDILLILRDHPSIGPEIAEHLGQISRSLEGKPSAPHQEDLWSIHPRGKVLLKRLHQAYQIAERAPFSAPPKNPPSHRHLILPRMWANFSPSSTAFRHGIRLAITLAIAVVVYHVIPLTRGYWVPLTVLVILRPDFQATVTRGLSRMVGTIIGILLSTVLLAVAYPHASNLMGIILVIVFGVALYATINVNYGLFSIFVTAEVMVLLSFFEKAPPFVTMHDRLLNTLIGGCLALVAYILWPSWQHSTLQFQLEEWVHHLREYLLAIIDAPYAAAPIRRQVRIDRTNLAGTMTGTLSEPHFPLNPKVLLRFITTLTHLTEIFLTLEWGVGEMSQTDFEDLHNAYPAWITRLNALEMQLHSKSTVSTYSECSRSAGDFSAIDTNLAQLEDMLPFLPQHSSDKKRQR